MVGQRRGGGGVAGWRRLLTVRRLYVSQHWRGLRPSSDSSSDSTPVIWGQRSVPLLRSDRSKECPTAGGLCHATLTWGQGSISLLIKLSSADLTSWSEKSISLIISIHDLTTSGFFLYSLPEHFKCELVSHSSAQKVEAVICSSRRLFPLLACVVKESSICFS